MRPALHRLASEARLCGSVQNLAGSVELVLEGSEREIANFIENLPARLPTVARLQSISLKASWPIEKQEASQGFAILVSDAREKPGTLFPGTSFPGTLFPPDLALCGECRAEVMDKNNRRFGYPFTTCTNCGPRFTVVNGTPYDRELTTLSVFPLCALCRAEYTDPQGRRFHAESIACPECGPQIHFESSTAKTSRAEALLSARKALSTGEIVAVRGVGGYLLAADAFNAAAVTELRKRKERPHKPLAVMARNMEVVRRFCIIPECGETLLNSPEAPILILGLRPEAAEMLPVKLLAPDTNDLGVMLPTSPLHLLLFEPLPGDDVPPFDLLVMTSGNRRGEPICISNSEARERLSDIADAFLLHDREINLRADDSLCALHDDRVQLWRRGRGYTPRAVRLKHKLRRPVLALGAELKNAIAVGDGDAIFPSAHIGDLDTPEAADSLETLAETFPRFLFKEPQVIAADLHPDLYSTVLGRRLAAKKTLDFMQIQHHFAHAAALMAERGIVECLALTFDGTGYGTDGTIWGGELLKASCRMGNVGFERLASFRPAPLPGGDAAVREPIRQIVGRLGQAGISINGELSRSLSVGEDRAAVWEKQVKAGINTSLSSGAGRLFDSFSVLLGFSPGQATYDGQAAVQLESAARKAAGETPELDFTANEEDGMLFIDWAPAFIQTVEQGAAGCRQPEWALAVHRAVARAAARMVEFGLTQISAPLPVALTGGVFMNRILTRMVEEKLREQSVEVLVHSEVPPNDGGLAVGQAYIAGRS